MKIILIDDIFIKELFKNCFYFKKSIFKRDNDKIITYPFKNEDSD